MCYTLYKKVYGIISLLSNLKENYNSLRLQHLISLPFRINTTLGSILERMHKYLNYTGS